MSLNSYTQFIDFPFEKLVPNGGVISGSQSRFEAAMQLMPFKLKGERVESQFSFAGIALPHQGPEVWTGHSYEFPPGSVTGFADLIGMRTQVNLTRVDFGPWREPFIEASLHFDFVFRMDGPWRRDVSLTLSTVLEYLPEVLDVAA